MKIIIINGAGGSGKDTFVELATTFLRPSYDILNLSTIDAVKDIARTMGWDGEKNEESRQFLADLKTAWSKYNNGANEKVAYRVLDEFDKEEYEKEKFIFIHCREAESINWFKDFFERRSMDVETLLITRDNIPTFENDADKNVDKYSYDIRYTNNGTFEDLSKKADIFAKYYM